MVYQKQFNNTDQVKTAIQTCWAQLSQELVNKAIEEWRPKLKAVVRIYGGYTQHLFY